jgi:hypothetical protein
MSHDVNRSQEQDPVSSEPLLTPEPTFTHANIAEAYREGLFGSRLDAELADIFASCHIEEEKPQQQGTIALTDKGIESLSCIAIIQGGQIIPVIDLQDMPKPTTLAQKMSLCALVARSVLDALIEIFDHWHRNDGAEGGILST